MALGQLEQNLEGLPSNDLKDQDLNYCLKSLQKKGFVKLQNFQKQSNKINYLRYVITPSGIAESTKLTTTFMKRKMKEYEELKAELERKK